MRYSPGPRARRVTAHLATLTAGAFLATALPAQTDLRLAPFFRRAEARGWVEPGWWLENIEAGFELWQGGTGLATGSFWAQP